MSKPISDFELPDDARRALDEWWENNVAPCKVDGFPKEVIDRVMAVHAFDRNTKPEGAPDEQEAEADQA